MKCTAKSDTVLCSCTSGVQRRPPRTSYIAKEWPYRGVTVLTEGSRLSQLLLLRLYLQRENREVWWPWQTSVVLFGDVCLLSNIMEVDDTRLLALKASNVASLSRNHDLVSSDKFTALQVSHVGLLFTCFSVPLSVTCTCQRLIIETVHSRLPLSHQCDKMR